MMSRVFRWPHRWRRRDDPHLVKRATPDPVDSIDELRRIINEAQEHDAADERRLYPGQGVSPASYPRRRLDRR
jgi:hypothetical protein